MKRIPENSAMVRLWEVTGLKCAGSKQQICTCIVVEILSELRPIYYSHSIPHWHSVPILLWWSGDRDYSLSQLNESGAIYSEKYDYVSKYLIFTGQISMKNEFAKNKSHIWTCHHVLASPCHILTISLFTYMLVNCFASWFVLINELSAHLSRIDNSICSGQFSVIDYRVDFPISHFKAKTGNLMISKAFSMCATSPYCILCCLAI